MTATILRVDGDTGTLSGSYRDGRFVLSHFSGARPLLLEVTPGADGTLTLRQNAKTELVAVRADTARAREIGEPTDPALHTRVKDMSEPFRFSFPDLEGKVVSNDADRRQEPETSVLQVGRRLPARAKRALAASWGWAASAKATARCAEAPRRRGPTTN